MPRYFFSLRLRDLESSKGTGKMLPDNKAALAHALHLVRQLKQRVDIEQPGILLIVENEAGESLFIIPF